MYKELSFNGIKQKIHLKPCILEVKSKDKKDYHKKWNLNKLTFYKDYKSKMLWFNTYGIGLNNLLLLFSVLFDPIFLLLGLLKTSCLST